MVLTALMTAVLCIAGPLVIPLPFSPVPLSLQPLPVYFTLYILGRKQGTATCVLYLLIGLIGLPVMSGYSGGPGKLFSPTGGYLFGYIFLSLISGWFIENSSRFSIQILGLILGTAACYGLGTGWLAFQAGMGFRAALMAGVIPFIPGDLAKIILAAFLGPKLRERLKRV